MTPSVLTLLGDQQPAWGRELAEPVENHGQRDGCGPRGSPRTGAVRFGFPRGSAGRHPCSSTKQGEASHASPLPAPSLCPHLRLQKHQGLCAAVTVLGQEAPSRDMGCVPRGTQHRAGRSIWAGSTVCGRVWAARSSWGQCPAPRPLWGSMAAASPTQDSSL